MGGVEHFGNVPLRGQQHVFSVGWLSFLMAAARAGRLNLSKIPIECVKNSFGNRAVSGYTESAF